MKQTTNVNTGWWFRSRDKVSSLSWRVASKFASYFGRSYTGKNFKTFSKNLSAGKFIGYDRTSDGDNDHVGFVTDTSGVLKTTEGISYYNFKVAQHTSNYNLWVSNSRNGWDALHKKYSKISYIIIK